MSRSSSGASANSISSSGSGSSKITVAVRAWSGLTQIAADASSMMGHIARPGRHFEMTSLNGLLAQLQSNAVDYVKEYLAGRAAD